MDAFNIGEVVNQVPEQLLHWKPMQNQLFELQGQMGASINWRSQRSIQGCINKAVMFVANTFINSSTRSGSVGIVVCLFARSVELTRMQADNTPALWSTSCLGICLLRVGRYPTGLTSSYQMRWRSSFQPGASCSKERSIEIRKGIAERNTGKLQEPSW